MVFSITAAPFHIPTNSAQRFQFLRILANIVILSSFVNGHPKQCDVVYLRGFDLYLFCN